MGCFLAGFLAMAMILWQLRGEGLLGMSVMNGDITTPYGSQSLTFIGMHMAPAIELPIYNSKDFKFIMFGGYDFSLTRTSFTTTDPFPQEL